MPTTNEVRSGYKESQLLGFCEDEKAGAMPQASEVGSRKFAQQIIRDRVLLCPQRRVKYERDSVERTFY